MKEEIRRILKNGLNRAVEEGVFEPVADLSFPIEIPKEPQFGDFSTSLALLLAPKLKKSPKLIAQQVMDRFDNDSNILDRYEIAGPGFINLFVNRQFWLRHLHKILEKKERFGRVHVGEGERVLVEYVSANPTGPLHVGHGRIAVVGDVLSRVLRFAGFEVTQEYYINDVGLQMEMLGQSTLVRYRELLGEKVEFPENGYQGEYVVDIAREVREREGSRLIEIPEEEARDLCGRAAIDRILQTIREDLDRFGVRFDNWFSERTLHRNGKVEAALNQLSAGNWLYEKDDALWFRTDDSGKEQDRVVRRGSGQYTYFASDIAYHHDKYERGFTRFVDVWGADHHGYVPRIKSVVRALGWDPGKLDVILVQFVTLKRGGETVSMSTRKGTFTELKEVIDEVGVDATRFFFLMRSSDSHLDFDLDLAKTESSENPVYYVQYAHARIRSIFRTAEERSIPFPSPDSPHLNRLELPEEIEIIKHLVRFPDWVELCAEKLQTHYLTHYVWELAGMFHRYYNKYRVISDDRELTEARLLLVSSIQTVIRNTLHLLGVSAPDSM